MPGGKSLKRRATGGTSASGGSRAKTPKQRPASEPTGQEAAIEKATAETGRRKRYIQPQVLGLIRDSGGNPVTITELTDSLVCEENSVQHAVLQLMKTVPQIEVVTKGRVWKWNHLGRLDLTQPEPDAEPEPAPVSALPAESVAWYEVGHDSSGNPLVRKDGDSEVRRLVSL